MLVFFAVQAAWLALIHFGLGKSAADVWTAGRALVARAMGWAAVGPSPAELEKQKKDELDGGGGPPKGGGKPTGGAPTGIRG